MSSVASAIISSACRYQPLDNKAKKLFMVDAGLSFNLPFPLLLRPQRAVDLYINFEYTMRESDDDMPFKELILAEKWAIQNKVPFPPVEKLVRTFFVVLLVFLFRKIMSSAIWSSL